MTAAEEMQIEELKKALRGAILNVSRIKKQVVDVGPDGNTYDIEWSDVVKQWAGICDLDLDEHDPYLYER